ncbi:hypothetical protein DID78_07115 [Candidatus Marinamargulisbacteria bacterium SCGC AG-343-D04]|nr:hypothetical protein DID78_07115 [Candidatus Marinamargulisbacteria bacterium SCGC AG-343-D04]
MRLLGCCRPARRGKVSPESVQINKLERLNTLAAEQGHARAKYNLGVMYDKGEGVAKDLNEALRLYRLAAEQGLAKAQNHMGWMYENGEGVEKDLKEAVRLYRLAADQGFAKAQKNLANMYREGKGVEKNENIAAKWYTLAAQQGHQEALNQLVELAKSGVQDVLQKLHEDFADAVVILENGEEKSVTDIVNEFSFECAISKDRYFKKGAGQEWEEVKLGDWHTLFFRKGADKSRQDAYVQVVGESKNSISLENLVHWLKDNPTCPINRDDLRLYSPLVQSVQKTPEDLNDECFKLGLSYQKGRGVDQSNEEAFKWYKLAADQGDAIAQTNLGWMHYKGEGVDQSDTKAFEWIQKSADQGHPLAQYILGCKYFEKGLTQSNEEAVKWFQKAASQGHKMAMRYLKEIATKNSLAQCKLGSLYISGDGVPQNFQEAVRLYTLAAEQGLAEAQFNLGTLFYKGKGVALVYSEKGRLEQAVKWYIKAVDQELPMDQANLGDVLL